MGKRLYILGPLGIFYGHTLSPVGLINTLDTSAGEKPGVDVMITIFCGFCQFSAKKIGVFSETNVMIKNFA
jgi:hypothetical protein